MIISAIKHEPMTKTIEVTWVEVTETEIVPVRCHGYSSGQKAEFIADVGDMAAAHVLAAGW